VYYTAFNIKRRKKTFNLCKLHKQEEEVYLVIDDSH